MNIPTNKVLSITRTPVSRPLSEMSTAAAHLAQCRLLLRRQGSETALRLERALKPYLTELTREADLAEANR